MAEHDLGGLIQLVKSLVGVLFGADFESVQLETRVFELEIHRVIQFIDPVSPGEIAAVGLSKS